MTRQALASRIAKSEGLKHQATVADIREILRLIVQIELDTYDPGHPQSGDITGWLEDEKVKAELKKKGKK